MLPCMHEGALEAGVDEVGRGCLAGPVAAAAVVWNPEIDCEESRAIRDSKRLSRAARERLCAFIEESAVATAVCFVGADRIDAVNILQATFDAMHGALDALDVDVDAVLVDGTAFRRYRGVRHHCVVDGDNVYTSIAAASIVAKVHRDAHMRGAHAEHPAYGWDRNVGYGTADHLEALRRHGVTPLHRRSFRPVRDAIREGSQSPTGVTR